MINLKQYLYTPACLRCGSFRVHEHLFCKTCFELEISKHYFDDQIDRSKETFENHLYLLRWHPNENKDLNQLVYRLKADYSVAALKIYSKLLFLKHEEQLKKTKFDAIIPIPSSNSKNVHAQLLAQFIGEQTGVTVKEALLKNPSNRQQKKLNVEDRKNNQGFALRPEFNEEFTKKNQNIELANRRFLLVDDVLTTGQSFRQCSELLLSSKPNTILTLFFRPKLLPL